MNFFNEWLPIQQPLWWNPQHLHHNGAAVSILPGLVDLCVFAHEATYAWPFFLPRRRQFLNIPTWLEKNEEYHVVSIAVLWCIIYNHIHIYIYISMLYSQRVNISFRSESKYIVTSALAYVIIIPPVHPQAWPWNVESMDLIWFNYLQIAWFPGLWSI